MGDEVVNETGLALNNQQHLVGAEAMESGRQLGEFQSMIVSAKRDPRRYAIYNPKIKEACQRKRFAEQAMYAYPRGKELVTGPSIRMAEVLAQNYGNLDFGIVELEQRNGESVMMAYCTDLENNVRQKRNFIVKHERHTKSGVQHLRDSRDIYELTANMGARRLRSCILSIIPSDIQEEAIEYCERTMAGNGDQPIADRIKAMVGGFRDLGVTLEMLEKRLGHKIEQVIETELVGLRKIFQSIKDGIAGREDFFEFAKEPRAASDDLKAKLATGDVDTTAVQSIIQDGKTKTK